MQRFRRRRRRLLAPARPQSAGRSGGQPRRAPPAAPTPPASASLAGRPCSTAPTGRATNTMGWQGTKLCVTRQMPCGYRAVRTCSLGSEILACAMPRVRLLAHRHTCLRKSQAEHGDHRKAVSQTDQAHAVTSTAEHLQACDLFAHLDRLPSLVDLLVARRVDFQEAPAPLLRGFRLGTGRLRLRESGTVGDRFSHPERSTHRAKCPRFDLQIRACSCIMSACVCEWQVCRKCSDAQHHMAIPCPRLSQQLHTTRCRARFNFSILIM